MFGYFAFLGVVCAGLTVRSARAEVGDKSLQLGRQMMELANTAENDVSRVNINGQTMFLGNALAKDDVHTVLNRYEKHCRTNAAQSVDSWREIAAADKDTQNSNQFFTSGLIRNGNDQEGVVICFVRSEQSKTSAKEAISSFTETGELGALGQLRYVYVKKTRKGNTHVLTAWTTSKFNLKEIMPVEGKDVPGSDFSEIPRIPDSMRVMSTQVEGTPFGVNVYRTDMGPDQVLKFYDDEMIKRGWFALDAQLKNKDNAKAHLYEKDGVVLTVATNVEQGKTFAGLGLAGVQATDKFEKR
jgi:hypothetical protein